MKIKSLIACTALLGCLSGASLAAYAEDNAAQSVQIPESDSGSFKKGDKLPDHFRRPDVVMQDKDWKKAGLPAPKAQAEWVHINDKYVMVSVVNSVVIDIVPVKK
ncbi:MAG: RcnB family protein [Pseudomonas sp.]|uniref:RcnB family protein n=1 Tax=Pseudomonas abieticivorans TaxID=2931382 RepID=UPI0020C11D57|nr:RcnB family protein [Pseudomonas sp. PIA16]MDE1165530.1 RcnB family protein [Pseudomonas sp.]